MGPSSLTTGANIFSAPVRINLTETSDPASPCLVPFPPTHCEEMSLRGAAAAALLLLQPLLAVLVVRAPRLGVAQGLVR